MPPQPDPHASTLKHYSEPEIWYIFDTLVSLVHSFKTNGYHHGDIQPKTILVDPQGFMKLLDNSLVNYGHTGYHKMLLDRHYTAALSPRLLEGLRNREVKPAHDPVKSDMFSVGMTLLCACTNSDLNEFYDWRQKEVLYNKVKEGFVRMKQVGYSDQLVAKIDGCLEVPEQRRTSNEEMFVFLQKHQNEIQDGELDFYYAGSGV